VSPKPALPVPSAKAAAAEPGAPHDTRLRVLEAAEALIRTEGLEALSFREVARRAGVSHQAPYHYFPDKEAILAALAGEGFALLAARLHEARKAEATPAARLEAIGRAYVSLALERPAHFKLMFRPELVKLDRFPGAVQCADTSFEELRLTVSEAIDAGLGRPEETDALVALCWSVAHGLAGLLLDGPLLHKLGAAGAQALIAPVMASFRLLVEARMGQARSGPALRAPAAKGRART
jgi:AcrR family transcriptional regulator